MNNRYFNNAATSWPKPPSVADTVLNNIRTCLGNPGRSSGVRSLRLLFKTRKIIAELFNIENTSRIIFTFNATHGINLGLKGFLKRGHRVVTSSMEHNAVIRPLIALEKQRDVTCEFVRCSPAGVLDLEEFRTAVLHKKTDLVVVNHCSNVVGTIQDLVAIGDICREAGVPLMVDAAQSAGILPLDVRDANIKILVAPGHKGLLGPAGTGFIYIDPELDLEPLFHGGTGSFSENPEQPETMPDKFESGTLNFHGIAGLKAALEFIRDESIESIFSHKNMLTEVFLNGFKALSGMRLVGLNITTGRLPVFSVVPDKLDVAELCNILEEKHGITTRAGLHCAPSAHRTTGTFPSGTLRISPGLYHKREDIESLLGILDRIVN